MNLHAPQPREAAPATPDAVVEVREADIPEEVRPIAVNIHEQIRQRLEKYRVTSADELQEKIVRDGSKRVGITREELGELRELAEKLEFLLRENGQVKDAIAMREDSKVMCLRLYGEIQRGTSRFGQDVRYATLARIAQVSLYSGDTLNAPLREFGSRRYHGRSARGARDTFLRALGTMNRRDTVELLEKWGYIAPVELWANFYTTCPMDEEDRKEEIVNLRSKARRGQDDALDQLAVLIDAERAVGMNTAETSTLALTWAREDRSLARDTLAVALADSGRGSEALEVLSPDNVAEVQLHTAQYALQHGDAKRANMLLHVMAMEHGGQNEYVRQLEYSLLPHWLRMGDRDAVHRTARGEAVAYLRENAPELVQTFYDWIPKRQLRFQADIDGAYAVFLAQQGDAERASKYAATAVRDAQEFLKGDGTRGSEVSQYSRALADAALVHDMLGNGEAKRTALGCLDQFIRSDSWAEATEWLAQRGLLQEARSYAGAATGGDAELAREIMWTAESKAALEKAEKAYAVLQKVRSLAK